MSRLALALLFVAAGASGCSCSDDGPDPCAAVACGAPCDDDVDCRSGTHCGDDGTCTATCTIGGGQCSSDEVCDDRGQCVDAPDPPDGSFTRRDGAASRDSSNVCAEVDVGARMIVPTVMLIIDQSSSMNEDFGDSNRWDALKDSLLDEPDGLIADLEGLVRFGVTLYSAASENGGNGGPPIGECPRLTTVNPAIDNHAGIDAVYGPADVIEDTPTGDAVEAVLDGILSVPDRGDDPVIFIIATDGEPDTCLELDPQNGQEEAIAAVERAYDNDIRTYIISVGEGVVSATHLQDMANAGLGRAPGDPNADYFVAGDDDGLRSALRGIVGGVLSCELELDGEIQNLDDACSGRVELNGRVLPCNDDNGWRANDANTIEVLGDACDELLTSPDASLEATFPCDVIIII